MTTINRRQLAKGAAWTVPVIAAAAAAPAASASTAAPYNALLYGTCFHTGLWYPWWRITSTEDAPVPAGVQIRFTFPGRTMSTTDVVTSTAGGTAGITDIQVSGDVWTAVTTREITNEHNGETGYLDLYSSGSGFLDSEIGDPSRDKASCTIILDDAVSSDNAVEIQYVGIWADGGPCPNI